jgi:TusA-related sulfurtransferase
MATVNKDVSMWPFRKHTTTSSIKANTVTLTDGEAVVDVRGQTCPGYLLAINKAVEQLSQGMIANLLITYPPCGEDVKAWCREIQYLGISQEEGMWVIRIKKS